MPVTDPMRREPTANGIVAGPNLASIASGVLLAATFAASAWTLPPPLVLPSVCIAALAAAGTTALLAWCSRARDQSRPTYWDLTGALTFIAMGAAILSEPDRAIALLELNAPTK
jgi:hypothetical protein